MLQNPRGTLRKGPAWPAPWAPGTLAPRGSFHSSAAIAAGQCGQRAACWRTAARRGAGADSARRGEDTGLGPTALLDLFQPNPLRTPRGDEAEPNVFWRTNTGAQFSTARERHSRSWKSFAGDASCSGSRAARRQLPLTSTRPALIEVLATGTRWLSPHFCATIFRYIIII